jgi:hypothetical protein
VKVGVLVHSHTGKTASFALHLAIELRRLGHEAEVIKLEPRQEPHWTDRCAVLEALPDLTPFDVIALGGPTWLGPSPVVLGFLAQASGLAEKRLYPFVTHQYPPLFGGRIALARVRRAARAATTQAFGGRAVRIGSAPNAEPVRRAAAEMAREIAASAEPRLGAASIAQ